MTVPGNSIIQALFALAFVIASGYAAGRIHQWYKQGLDRDQAYRTGYDQASNSMFDMAIRKRQQTAARSVTEGDFTPPAEERPERQHLVGQSRRRIQADPAPKTGRRRRRFGSR
ncbi:hypothetical protein Asp14428_56570 [Actinoplanes sp. NBRC 14428]|uniref:Uncharacterized protein n=1 Tax=Pseudosporangium ferrugineum TaxID=439699 RepID=A0A2T0RDM2_9ACTN|nr:hypothetical protein [Pseudosporangium ferrugineum]PRY19253.1 hypothetical protein CLV70_13616 [Pseudosporangium ferrugineum]BCJ54182.1 hypothetical protein Asp14428_56570 [Actinoplanes sp. NBRC 14428]